MKLATKGLTVSALAAALGLSLLGPHRAAAAPDTLSMPGDTDLAVAILTPIPSATFSGTKPVEISAFYQGAPSNQITSVDLYLDGVKAATKTLDVPETRGVVSFLVDAAQLTRGTHRIVIRATAADQEVKSAKGSFSFLSTDNGSDTLGQPSLPGMPQTTPTPAAPTNTTPVLRLMNPSTDGKVQGTVRLQVEASDPSGKSPYVSLFIDHAFKTLKNYSPYEFEWDTTTYSNGYHTIEVFGYNDSANVGHAKPLRVYVNNPGGETEIRTDLHDAPKPVKVATQSTTAPAKPKLRTKGIGRPFPLHRPDASLMASAFLMQSQHDGDALLRLAQSELSNPFVPDTPKAPSVASAAVAQDIARAISHTPLRNFKPMPRISQPTGLALLAEMPFPTRPSAKAPRLMSLNAIRLPENELGSPFLAVPQVATPVVRIPTYRVLLPAMHAPHLNLHFSSGLSSLLRSVGQTSLLFNNATVRLDRPLAERDSILFGPLRQIFEQGGGTLTWQSRTSTVRAKNATKDILLTIGKNSALVNLRPVALAGAPYLASGRTMVPLSFVSVAMDANVQYDATTGHLLIVSKK